MPTENESSNIKLPPLRKGITCTFSEYDVHGKPQWMIHDAGRNKFFIIGWTEHQILEHWYLGNPHDIIESINQKTTLNLELSDIESFYTFLKKNYLMEQSGYEIHKTAKEQHLFAAKDSWITWLIHHYLFFRIPLWHPDSFLIRTKSIGNFFFNRYVFYTMLILGFLAIYQVSTKWQLFTHTFASIFTLQGVFYYFIAFTICKFFHEMGHAYMCRRFDIPVQSLGVAFLVFWPVLYTDTTLSWVLKSKQRMKIALAGVWMESYITIFAALVWCNTNNLIIQTICYMTISINWIGSLLINVSPFMRFDGYYILADFLHMPNLQPRAFALTRWQIRRWLFGWPDPPPEVYAKNLHRFLVVYSISTWIYRLVLYIGIALLVYHFFIKIVGIILLFIEVYYFMLAPVITEFRTWYLMKDHFTWNNRTKFTTACAISALLLFFLPIRMTITLPGTLSYLHGFIIAQEDGMIDKELPKEGSVIKKGEIITELKSEDLENALDLVILQYKLKLAQLRNAKINLENANEKNTILSDINKSQAEYKKLYAMYDKLTLRSPFDGILYEKAPDLHPGVFVTKNEWIADVIDTSKVLVEAYVNEEDLYLVKKGLTGYFYPEHLSEQKVPVRVIEIDALNTRELSCAYTRMIKQNKSQSVVVDTPCYNANEFGGYIPTYLTEDEKYVPVQSVYRITLATQKPEQISYVERGRVELNTQSHTYAGRVFYWLRSIFVQQGGF